MKTHLESGWRQVLWITNPAELSFATADIPADMVDWIKRTCEEFNHIQTYLNQVLTDQTGEFGDPDLYLIPFDEPTELTEEYQDETDTYPDADQDFDFNPKSRERNDNP